MPEYDLPGTQMYPQVEPAAGYWFRCPILRTVRFDEVRTRLDREVPAYPASASPEAQQELAELRSRYERRHDPAEMNQADLGAFLVDGRYVSPRPAGAVLNRRSGHLPIIRTGAELARLFEGETPGLWHRHVLNVLLDPLIENGLASRLSPPRQALLWAALDTAIASALMAVWHYKWLATGVEGVARRERPKEADEGLGVLYDTKPEWDGAGSIIDGEARQEPAPTPGSPRHPAYGSGHSTYSAAASFVLAKLLPDYADDWKKLAESIGEARIWGGVHWRTDHTVGRLIGETVGQMIIEQLQASGIEFDPAPVPLPPSRVALEKEAEVFQKECGKGRKLLPGGLVPQTESFQGRQG